MTKVYLSLGSNMGDRKGYLEKAIHALGELPQSQLVKVSSIYETPAWGKTDQADFLNMACQLETDLAALDLLDHCQAIEKSLDRVRHEHWGPRTVDIDLLLFGDEIWQEQCLTLPHPYMQDRAFVLVPLLELENELKTPGTGVSYAHYLSLLDAGHVRLFKP